MSTDHPRAVRCAIYTRKSTTYGLRQQDNSLVTQREVCSAYIKSQRHRQWSELPQAYDDGGFSGGTTERPALRRLLGDIESGRVDVVVIYKIDRLTRSLTDFVRLLDVLRSSGTSFVSVTQTFDTSDSMGRLVLNILLTFAQFERELMSDRVRDRKAAMLRNGRYAGGLPPFGYLMKDGLLVPDPERASWVAEIYDRIPHELQATIVKDLKERGCRARSYVSKAGNQRGGTPLSFGGVRGILRNPIYTGAFIHRGEWIEAAIEPLVSRGQWERAQQVVAERTPPVRDPNRYLLLGLLYDEAGRRMKGKAYGLGQAKGERYYRSEHAMWSRQRGAPRKLMVDAERIEDSTLAAMESLLRDRTRLRDAVLALGEYSKEIAAAIRSGASAAGRMRRLDRSALRVLLLRLIARIDLSATEFAIHINCHGLLAFLRNGAVAQNQTSDRQAFRMYTIRSASIGLCGKGIFNLGITPRTKVGGSFDPYIAELIHAAHDAQGLVIEHRDKSISVIAKSRNMSSGYFSRLLRLNYLAPDIQTAILDGTQPPEVTRKTLLFGPLPLDWAQQRALLGFSAVASPLPLGMPLAR